MKKDIFMKFRMYTFVAYHSLDNDTIAKQSNHTFKNLTTF